MDGLAIKQYLLWRGVGFSPLQEYLFGYLGMNYKEVEEMLNSGENFEEAVAKVREKIFEKAESMEMLRECKELGEKVEEVLEMKIDTRYIELPPREDLLGAYFLQFDVVAIYKRPYLSKKREKYVVYHEKAHQIVEHLLGARILRSNYKEPLADVLANFLMNYEGDADKAFKKAKKSNTIHFFSISDLKMRYKAALLLPPVILFGIFSSLMGGNFAEVLSVMGSSAFFFNQFYNFLDETIIKRDVIGEKRRKKVIERLFEGYKKRGSLGDAFLDFLDENSYFYIGYE